MKDTLVRQSGGFRAIHNLIHWWGANKITNVSYVKLLNQFKETVPGLLLPTLKHSKGIKYEEWDKSEEEFKLAMPESFKHILQAKMLVNNSLDYFKEDVSVEVGNSNKFLTYGDSERMFGVRVSGRDSRLLVVIASGYFDSTPYNVTNFENWDSEQVYTPDKQAEPVPREVIGAWSGY